MHFACFETRSYSLATADIEREILLFQPLSAQTVGMFHNADLGGLLLFFEFYLIACLFVCIKYVYEHGCHSSRVDVRQPFGVSSPLLPLYGFQDQTQVSRLVPQATSSAKPSCHSMRDYFK